MIIIKVKKLQDVGQQTEKLGLHGILQQYDQSYVHKF